MSLIFTYHTIQIINQFNQYQFKKVKLYQNADNTNKNTL